MEFPVRYQPVWGGFMLVAGGFILLVGVMLAAPVQLFVGALNLALGAAFLSQPWIVVTPTGILVKNLLGMTLKRQEYASFAELQVHDGGIWKDGVLLRSKSFVARADDWERVLDAIQQA